MEKTKQKGKEIPKTVTGVSQINNHQAGRIWVSTFSKTEFLETGVFFLITRNMRVGILGVRLLLFF